MNITMKIHLVIFAFMIMSLMSCSSFSLVNSEVYDHDALASHKTFHIVDLKMGTLPPQVDSETYECIVEAIRTQMLERGYRESANSPLLINFAITVHNDTVLTHPGSKETDGPHYSGTYPCYIYPQEYYWASHYLDAGVIDGIYEDGVLTIDVVNIKKKEPLFTSSVASIVDIDGNYRNDSEIDKAVILLFSDYPVAPMPQYRD